MRTKLTVFSPDDLSPNLNAIEAFQHHCFSHGVTEHRLGRIAKLYETDPRLAGLLDLMKSHGFELRPETMTPRESDPLRHMSWSRAYEYDHSDFVDCEYLLLEPKDQFEPYGWIGHDDKTWDLRLYGQDVPDEWRSIDLGTLSGSSYTYVISDRLRVALEQAKLVGLILRPVMVHEYYLKWNPPPLWEMDARSAMPLVSPEMKVRIMANWDSIDNLDPRIVARYPKVDAAGLLYRRSDFYEGKVNFDIQRAVEPWAGPAFVRARVDDTPMVVSKKFYNVCRSVGEFGRWSPVRIE